MHALAAALYPLNRSITGAGVRETLRQLGRLIDLEIAAVPSGTRVHDWEVPPEWTIRDAYIKDPAGRRIVDWRRCNLHVVGYSAPVHRTMSLQELRPRLHTLPAFPDWVPYRTSYYDRDWGFCLSQRTLDSMAQGDYEVCIDSTLEPGALHYGECVLRGELEDEVLIFTHVCHPSLGNDNLSGIAVACFLARALSRRRLRYTYRFLFAPATIGSIAWLARNEERLDRIRHGLVISDVGDPGHLRYKRSRRGGAEIDRAAEHVLATTTGRHEILDFSPWGYDERQFCSPGIDLPVGRLTRSPEGCYPQYHTSADDLDLVRPEFLAESLRALQRIVVVLEANRRYRNLAPKGEPQLGRRGLYASKGGYQGIPHGQLALLWVLNQSDGKHSLLDIAMRAGLDFATIRKVARRLVAAGLLAECGAEARRRGASDAR